MGNGRWRPHHGCGRQRRLPSRLACRRGIRHDDCQALGLAREDIGEEVLASRRLTVFLDKRLCEVQVPTKRDRVVPDLGVRSSSAAGACRSSG